MNVKIFYYKVFLCIIAHRSSSSSDSGQRCSKNFKYLYGDALSDAQDCIGPNGSPYPSDLIARSFPSNERSNTIWPSSRKARLLTKQTLDPKIMQKALIHSYMIANNENVANMRTGKSAGREESSCPTPSRLCKTRYNTTAPMYGVSLTSGQPVTIVQKFPDLLQQVVFEVCESSECDVVRGECTQTYVPYLFLVIPLGPVTLTGQDYVLVESGCTCKPKYSNSPSPSPVSVLPVV